MAARQFSRLSSSGWRSMAVAGSSMAIGVLARREDQIEKRRSCFGEFDQQKPVCAFSSSSEISSLFEPNKTALDPAIRSPAVESINQASSRQLPSSSDSSNAKSEMQVRTKVYDFIILGHGNAGQSAARTLRKRCPKVSELSWCWMDWSDAKI